MANYPTGATPDTEDFNRMAQGNLDSTTVASAATVNIDDNYFYTVSGTTQINSFNPSAARVGDRIMCLFSSQLVLNATNSGNIKFPGAHESQGFSTLPNTICEFQRVGTDWYMINTNRNLLLPHWRVRMLSTQNVNTGNTNQVNFDQVTTSNYASSFDTGANQLDAPYTGRYQAYFQQRMNGTAGGNFRSRIIKNGSLIAEDRNALSVNQLDGQVLRLSVDLSAGDTLAFESENQTGSQYTIQTNPDTTFAEIRMLEVY